MTIIQVKRALSTVWASSNPILAPGEFGYETDTGKLKMGDGTQHWNDIPGFQVPTEKGQPNGYAGLDGDGLVPLEQLPITNADWATLEGKPTYVAAGATKADARGQIDAEYTGNKGQTGGYASLDETGRVPVPQLPSGMVVDSVQVNSESFQFYSGDTPVGDPISTVLGGVDGGTPTSVTSVLVDGGIV